MRRLPCSEADGFCPAPPDWHADIICLCSPNNPTGCIYTQETLTAIHDVLKDKPIFVLCDDVYRTLIYTDGYHSFAEFQDMRDRIIVIQHAQILLLLVLRDALLCLNVTLHGFMAIQMIRRDI